MVRQVVHDNEQSLCPWIRAANCPKCCQKITHAFSFVDRTSQTIAMDIIKSKKLLGSRMPMVRRSKAIRLLNPRPVLPVDGFKFKRTPFVKTKNNAVRWTTVVKLKNAVFFSQTPGREILSTSWFSAPRDLLGVRVFEPIRCLHRAKVL